MRSITTNDGSMILFNDTYQLYTLQSHICAYISNNKVSYLIDVLFDTKYVSFLFFHWEIWSFGDYLIFLLQLESLLIKYS